MLTSEVYFRLIDEIVRQPHLGLQGAIALPMGLADLWIQISYSILMVDFSVKYFAITLLQAHQIML